MEAVTHKRVTDFGIAITTSDTAPHTMLGTPGYMGCWCMNPAA